MTNLFLIDLLEKLPLFIFVSVVVFFVIAAVGSRVKEKIERQKQQQQPPKPNVVVKRTQPIVRNNQNKAPQENTHTHVGNKIVSNEDGHEHLGGDREEYYEKIVGSLGEVKDEGCVDLDGVRLIVDDLAYSGEDDKRDYTEVVKAMVIGEIINTPRFKKPYDGKH